MEEIFPRLSDDKKSEFQKSEFKKTGSENYHRGLHVEINLLA